MKKSALKHSVNYLHMASEELSIVKDEAIKARKKAKSSAKPKWTASIETINNALESCLLARKYARLIPKRV